MPYHVKQGSGVKVAVEHTHSRLHVYYQEQRVFSCEVIAASNELARVVSGFKTTGLPTMKIYRAIETWLVEQGFKSLRYERGNPGNQRVIERRLRQ